MTSKQLRVRAEKCNEQIVFLNEKMLKLEAERDGLVDLATKMEQFESKQKPSTDSTATATPVPAFELTPEPTA